MPKIDLSHFTSWCCCPLPPPPAHPDADNGSSVSQCLLWRAEHLRARRRTTFKPLSLSPSLFSCRGSSLRLPRLSLIPLFFDCLNGFFFSFVSLPLHTLFPFFLVQFSICVLLCGSFYCIALFPVRSIYPCMAKPFPLRARLLWSLLLLHLCLPCRHSPALHLRHWAFLCLLLTFCLPTHFKFN